MVASMKTRGRTAPLITIAVLALTAALIPASPATAKARPECPQNSLCVWTKANYEGERLVLDRLGASNKIFKKMNDKVSSVRLRYSGGAAELYEDTNGEGDTLCLLDAPGLRKNPDLSGTGGGPDGYDDMVSSSYLSEEPFGTCF
jgi:Peptidase inhibitor family I36